MMEQKIEVTTHKKGYVLMIDQEEFMYYTAEGLLAGFSVRLGLERLHTMNHREIGRLMDAAKRGSLPKQLQKEVDRLNAQIKEQKMLIAQLRHENRELKRKYEESEEPLWYSN